MGRKCDKKIEAHNKFKITSWYEEKYMMLIMICSYYNFSFPWKLALFRLELMLGPQAATKIIHRLEQHH
jgi:hypothetical protein